MADLFINEKELSKLTGRKMKSLQITWLRTEGIPFRVSATGHPVVTRAAVEGRKPEPETQPKNTWVPRVVGAA